MEEVGQCDFHSGTVQSREKSMEHAREKDNRVENSVHQEQMAVNVRKMSMMTCRISGSVYLECSSALLSTFKSVLQFSNQGRCQVCQDVGSAFFSFDLSPNSSCVCTHQQTQTVEMEVPGSTGCYWGQANLTRERLRWLQVPSQELTRWEKRVRALGASLYGWTLELRRYWR